MEVQWDEKLFLATLRAFRTFHKSTYYVTGFSINTRDGGYVNFDSWSRNCRLDVILFPGFHINLIRRRTLRYLFTQHMPYIDLVQEKNRYPEFAHLPDKYENEDHLLEILEGYKQLIEAHYIKNGVITF